MIIVKVMYTAQADYVAQNQANIRAVMSDLRALGSPSMLYNVCLCPDQKTFIHTAFFESEEGRKILNELPSFKTFQEQLKASSPEVSPKQELLSLVDSSKDLFH